MSTALLLFFVIAFVLIFALRLAKIGTMLAFLLAGIIAGPHVLGLLELSEIWGFLGNIGIMFLWFTMGLELNIKRLWQMRSNIFGFGAAQVLMVAVMLFPILFGFTTWSIMGTVMVSLILAMSSTSSDLQILADRNELQTNMGRQTFSILLFQDLLSIPLLAMLPIFAGKSINLGGEVVDIIVMSVGLVLGVLIVGRYLLNPLMRMVAKLKSKEAFLIAIMLNIVIWAAVMEWIGLPPAMGAFLSGMLLSETVYRHHIKNEIAPYAILFLSFFFIALGMGLNLNFLAENWIIVALGVVALILIKFTAIYIVARVRNIKSKQAFLIALILAQGGEFGLLILQTMKTSGIEAIPFVHGEILTAVIILSIMATPLLLVVYDFLNKNGKIFPHARAKKLNKKVDTSKNPDVIICGFGRVGETVAKMLDSQKITYSAIDLDVDEVIIGRQKGFNVFYGDTTSPDILLSLGLSPKKTKSVVIALDNSAVAKRTVRAIKTIAPKVKIFARARNLAESNILLKEGVREAFPETIESSLLLGQGVLENVGVSPEKIEKILSQLRTDNYGKQNKKKSGAKKK